MSFDALPQYDAPSAAFPPVPAPVTSPAPPTATDPGAPVAERYRELRRALLGFLRKHTGDDQVAEDLLHDVMLKALAAAADAARTPHNLTGWLYAVARNAAMDHHRRHRPTEPLPEDLVADEADEPFQALSELALCLRPMAERLPETYRHTVLAAEFDGRALREVADDQGLSLTAVKTRASRGRRLLMDELLRCCRVELSASGQVLDYDLRAASACAPQPGVAAGATGCGRTTGRPGTRGCGQPGS